MMSDQTRRRPFSVVRVLCLSAIGGFFVLLYANGVIPYYIRERSLKAHFQGLPETEAQELIRDAQSLIDQHRDRESFSIQGTEQNLAKLPPAIRKLEPVVVSGSATHLCLSFDGVGNSVTVVFLRKEKAGWVIVGHFGLYSNPPIKAYPKDPKPAPKPPAAPATSSAFAYPRL